MCCRIIIACSRQTNIGAENRWNSPGRFANVQVFILIHRCMITACDLRSLPEIYSRNHNSPATGINQILRPLRADKYLLRTCLREVGRIPLHGTFMLGCCLLLNLNCLKSVLLIFGYIYLRNPHMWLYNLMLQRLLLNCILLLCTMYNACVPVRCK